MASENIDAVFAQIEKDFVELSKTAARNAAVKAQKDIRAKADKFISEYYSSYTPVWYHRKKALYALVENFYQETVTGKGITIKFGIQYVPENIAGVHRSYSPYHQGGGAWISRMKDADSFHFDSGDNGIPSADWITNQFIEGIHPSGKLGDNGGSRDGQSPDDKMKKFFDNELDDLVMSYVNKYLLSLVGHYF
jgi:hypothetical protein